MKGIFKKTECPRSPQKTVWGSILITLVAVSGFLLFSKASPALAACSPATSFGTDTLSLSVPTTGTYTAWVRLSSPDGTNNQIMMSIDGGTCFTMGATMPANTWTWVNKSAGTSTPVTVSLTAGTHSVVFTGNQAGIGLDEAQFLTNASCIPIGITDNCTINQPTPPTVSISAPTSGATVSGSAVTISAAASDSVAVSQVQFIVDSTVVATDTTSPYTTPWNSTAVADGTHTIKAIATNTSGLTTTATETVTVNNAACTGNPNPPSNLHDTDTAPLPANKVDFGWTAGSPAANCTLSGYNIYRNGSATPLNGTPVNAVVYSDATVAATTTYTYQIASVDTSGHISAKIPATPLSVTTGINCAQGNGAPTTPTGVAQTLGTLDYTTISLNWNASTANNGCTLSGYHIYRDGSPTPIATLGLVTSFKDNGPLASDSSHNYTIDAFDSGGNKSASTGIVAMITKKDDVAPTMPTGFTGTAPTAGAVNLSWAASTDLPNPGAVGIGGYYIYRNNTPLFSTSATTTSFSDTTVRPSTTYIYTIAAHDTNNNVSPLTADITVTTPAPTCSNSTPPTVPGVFHSTAATLTSISLMWNASTPGPGCTLLGYQVFRNHTPLTVVTSTNFTDIGLLPNTNYIYDLVAVDTSSHASASTADLTVATLPDTTAPTGPTNFVVSAPSPTQVSLGWTPATDNIAVTGYNIYRNGTFLKAVGTVTNYADSTVSPNTTYAYLLEAFDGGGNKSTPRTPSTPTTITTPQSGDTQKPTIPTNLAAVVVGQTSVALTWNASTDNVAVAGYNVMRNGTKVNTSLVGSPSYTDTGLTANTHYTYTVVAVDTSNNTSDLSGAISVTTQPIIGPIPGDINGDNKVDLRDFNILLIAWGAGQRVTPGTRGDLTGNGIVDIADFNPFLIDWGIYNSSH